jgi:hypothetical protein
MLNNEMQHFTIEMSHLIILKLPRPFFWWELRNVLWARIQFGNNKLVGSLSLIPLNKPRDNQLTIINVISNTRTLTTFTIIPLSYHI